jgi:exodeoxyribonuclease VII large subunit
MVSHTRVKTPTAAAAFLISHLKEVMDALDNAQDCITRHAIQKLSSLNTQLSAVSEAIPRLFTIVRTKQESRLDALFNQIMWDIQRRLISESHRIEVIEEKAKSLDPGLLLKRGYSITLHEGKVVRDPHSLQKGDDIETRLEKGTIKSTII